MIATPYQRAECERLARQIWAEREKGFPRFVQQTWEQGTQLARDATLADAARRLGLLPAVKAGEMVTLPTPASKPFPKCRVVGFTANKLKVGK